MSLVVSHRQWVVGRGRGESNILIFVSSGLVWVEHDKVEAETYLSADTEILVI